MAHRLAFPANVCVPLAVKLAPGPGDGWLMPYHPEREGDDSKSEEPAEGAKLSETRVELFALDMTPLDLLDGATDDALWFKASFTDTLGRDVEVRTLEVVSYGRARQCFGGVATNVYKTWTSPEDGRPIWSVQPLQAWGRFAIRVNEALTDSGVLGSIELTLEAAGDTQEVAAAAILSVTLYPEHVFADGESSPMPIQAAEDLGMAGWTLRWEGVEYLQAPVLSVRVERGDTLRKIAEEMSVDPEAVFKSNGHLRAPGEPNRGELLRVPLFVTATTPAPKRVHPSVALTWKEMMHGWTTLN